MEKIDPLCKQVLGRMLDMVIRERGHGVVAVVVVGLVAHLDALNPSVLGGLFEVLGEQLALLVEVVAGALVLSVLVRLFAAGRCCTYHVDQHIQGTLPLLD